MIDGGSLTISQVVALTQSAARVDIDPNVADRISASI